MKWIDRFCYKHRRFGVKNLMLYIIALNAFVFVLSLMPNGAAIISSLYFDRGAILAGQVWRIATFLFIPPTFSLLFVIFVLYFYYMIGRAIEAEWGQAKFTLYYLISALLTMAVCFIFDVSLDAYFINLSLFMAFATFFPDYQILLFFVIPVKIKYLAWLNAAFFFYSIVTSSFPYLLAPVIAMGAYLLFFWDHYVRFLKNRELTYKSRARFKGNLRQSGPSRGYIHKCAVCGVTDVDSPSEEFRYCSICSDYACYCSKHIFDHAHHQQ